MWWIIIIVVIIAWIFIKGQQNQAELKAANNRYKYPNFEKELRRHYGNDLKLLIDDGKIITYCMYTLFNSKIVGTTYFSLHLGHPMDYVQVRYQGVDKILICSTGKHLPQGNRTIEEYNQALIDALWEVQTHPDWTKSTWGVNL